MKNRVCLLLIATGKYDIFLPALMESICLYFLLDCHLDVHLFTDKKDIESKFKKCSDSEVQRMQRFREVKTFIHEVEHHTFPYSTLNRFHFFKKYATEIYGYDYYCYLDVDTLIKEEITSDILSPRTAVQHCGFVRREGSFETRIESSTFVPLNLRMKPYFGGGFWCFDLKCFWLLVDDCIRMIETDKKNGIIPVWHDESCLNRHLIEYTPTKILSPSYHYPEGNIERYKKMWYPDNYDCKILLLEKDHEKLRT